MTGSLQEQVPLDLRGGRVPYARVGSLEVNEHGVVVGGHEVLSCLRTGKWEGVPIAELRVAPNPYRPGWIWAYSYSLPHGGEAHPLCVDGPLHQAEPSREAAVEAARVAVARGLSRYLDCHRPGPESRALADWLKKGFA